MSFRGLDSVSDRQCDAEIRPRRVAARRRAGCLCRRAIGWMVDVESLVEGLEYLVQVPVSLSLLGVPVDGFRVGSRGGSKRERRQVVDGEDSNADAGKEGGSPSGR